ncbi:hypothetical protein AVEN_140972-1 [Araneus ventricosus]|uniref:Uncharacterized protein n=1 Tax=Araneus ventricosus TaxID=182803 RepID=A0A4Y2X622_ARAVE|nr:hypothetical protein AVEN_9721-1 [Araneus ventricosus]GBO43565.1 hypothetical protein AVEN_178885-1 [Araneus ventricosus]GBO43567.1 hypothetical protein AVEN_216030-1 [Araneus ventricosus]GBO43677.1 hypothetical protein AVEN_140972-1 [Araneus ventricosus]
MLRSHLDNNKLHLTDDKHNRTKVNSTKQVKYYQLKFDIQILRNEINYKNRIAMGLVSVPASTDGVGPELAYKALESQFRFSWLTANDAFFIIEVLWVQIVISVSVRKFN